MANRFWVTQPVSGAIVSAASPPQVRLTVSSTTGMTTGDVRTVAGIVGTTEANGTWTITVIDGTHIDLQGTTFTNVYTSGGSVNGKWDATNANNWVSTSGGTNYGQTVPGSGDAVTFDASSGGGTVTPNATISVVSITGGAFTGTLAFNTNNNNVNLSSILDLSGSGTTSWNLGTGTWTITRTTSGTCANFANANLTLTATSATIAVAGATTAQRLINFGTSRSYGTISIGANSSGGTMRFQPTTAVTIATLTAAAGTVFQLDSSITYNITNALSLSGTPSSPIMLQATTATLPAPISSANNGSFSFCGVRDITCAGGGTFVAVASYNFGGNTGVTVIPPSASGIIGG